MDVIQCIHKRRAIRKFLQKPLEKEKLGILLDAARMAPSSGNIQNWRFIIIKDPPLKLKVAEACYDQNWIVNAPVLIVICAELDKARRFYDVRGEKLYSIQNCAVAAENILIAATFLELGSNFVSTFDDEMMSNILRLPDSAKAQCIIPIGYTKEKPEVPVRYPLETLAYFDSWGKRFEEIEHVLREYGGHHKKAVDKTLSKVQDVHKKVEKESQGIFKEIKKKIKDFHGKI